MPFADGSGLGRSGSEVQSGFAVGFGMSGSVVRSGVAVSFESNCQEEICNYK